MAGRGAHAVVALARVGLLVPAEPLEVRPAEATLPSGPLTPINNTPYVKESDQLSYGLRSAPQKWAYQARGGGGGGRGREEVH